MTKKRRSVLMSVITLMLALSLVAGGTYALFSDQVTLTTHLKAGTLDITLQRTNLVTKELDNNTGFLTSKTSSEVVDFSGPTDRNVFDLDVTDKIVPGCAYNATLKITNNTDVAFVYWIEIVNRNTEDNALSEQVKVSVKMSDGSAISENVKNGMQVGSALNPIGTLAKTESDSFVVGLLFLDLPNNNSAKNMDLNFDVIVHAVQALDSN